MIQRRFHTFEYAYEDRVFNLIFLIVFLLGAGTSEYLRRVHIDRPAYVPKPVLRKVSEILLREPQAPKPIPEIEKTVSVPSPAPKTKISKAEWEKRRTSPPPLSAVGSPKNLPRGEGGDARKMVARKGLLGLLSKTESDPQLRAYQPSKKKDVSEELNQALKNLSGTGDRQGTGESDDFLGVGNLPEVAKKGSDIGYILNAAKIGEVRETQVEFHGGIEELPAEVEVVALKGKKGAELAEAEIAGGGRTYNDIRKIVASYLGGLRYIYNKELRQDPSLKGKITVIFEISPAGLITQTSLVGSSLDSRPFEQAILDNIRKWKFPRIPQPDGFVKVTYPVLFLPPST